MLLAASIQLTDNNAGEGGFCIIPGSHKASFPCPQSVKEHLQAQEHVVQPVTRAGDVVLFTEACTHGTLAWQAERTRRVALYRFAPANAAYGRAYLRSEETWPPAFTEGMNEAQLAVMAAPYHSRLDRQAPAEDGVHVTVPEPRARFKKAFDNSVFGTQYF
jgi:ectoine hydroxylase-related dioxygenase (phytanoyl-CoA dioxygenase family)